MRTMYNVYLIGLDADCENSASEVEKAVVLHADCDAHFVQQLIRELFNLNKSNLVLKVCILYIICAFKFKMF